MRVWGGLLEPEFTQRGGKLHKEKVEFTQRKSGIYATKSGIYTGGGNLHKRGGKLHNEKVEFTQRKIEFT